MLTIISFILTILGGINWLLIGLLQYDFVAGIFGYQASILSRIIYIIVGIASAFLVFKLIQGKGTIAVFSRKNKQDLKKNIEKISHNNSTKTQPATAENVEVSHEIISPSERTTEKPRNLFDEHLYKDND